MASCPLYPKIFAVPHTLTVIDSPKDLERDTQRIGSELLKRAREEQKRWTLSRFEERIVDRMMADPVMQKAVSAFMTQFAKTPADRGKIAEAISTYFGEASLLNPLRWAAFASHRFGLIDVPIVAAARLAVTHMAGRYICASDLARSTKVVRSLESQGYAVTLDRLGEDVQTPAEAAAYLNDLKNQIRFVGRVSQAANISMKVSGLHPLFATDPVGLAQPDDYREEKNTVTINLLSLFRHARQSMVAIMVDAERYIHRDVITHAFSRAASQSGILGCPDLGIVAQCYFRDALAYINALARAAQARHTPQWVRLVKGAYYEKERADGHPVWTSQAESDLAYEEAAEQILGGNGFLKLAAASHNPRSLARAIALAQRHGVTDENFEVQMLYGMGNELKPALKEMGVRVRQYVPYGDLITSLAYLLRRFIESSAEDSALMRLKRLSHLTDAEVLRNPADSRLN